MHRYIGLDAHLGSCTFAVMGPSGRRLREDLVETSTKALREFVRSIAGTRRLCMEEGSLSEWLYEVLEPVVDELVVVQPTRSHGSKSDALDAWARAEELRVRSRAGRRVFKAPGRYRALREAVRTYDAVCQDQTRAKLRLRSLFSSRGIQGDGGAIYDPYARRTWLAKLPRSCQRRGQVLADELDRLIDVFEDAEQWLKQEARRADDVRLLMTAPGLGEVRAAQLVAHVVTPHRFRTKRQFWSYCGLGIVVRSSSDWKRRGQQWERRQLQQTRGLNKQSNRALKNVFKGATMKIITLPDDPLSLGYQASLAKGAKPNLAKLTTARRLAAIVLGMLETAGGLRPEQSLCKRITGDPVARVGDGSWRAGIAAANGFGRAHLQISWSLTPRRHPRQTMPSRSNQLMRWPTEALLPEWFPAFAGGPHDDHYVAIRANSPDTNARRPAEINARQKNRPVDVRKSVGSHRYVLDVTPATRNLALHLPRFSCQRRCTGRTRSSS